MIADLRLPIREAVSYQPSAISQEQDVELFTTQS